jgi:DMSO/TMAO reductase YedYZ molybdopterin-dependent catalytic subunit
MSKSERTLIVERASRLVERSVEESRASGKLDRRDFLRLGSLGLGSALLSACNSEGPKWAQKWLNVAERKNEVVERLLFSHRSMDKGSPGAIIAGNKMPSYFIADTVPKWDYAKGPWSLQIGGTVKNPVTLTMADLMKLPRRRQRVDHFCVEGWTAVEILSGVAMTSIAQLVHPTPDASYVDFASFDMDYHESWDIESALHPQTLVVYGKEDVMLTPAYGAPARVHSPIKLGYKNTKYLTKIMFMPERNGGYWSDLGYEWYGGT